MHYFIFPEKDSYISQDSPSDVVLYRDSKVKNYGLWAHISKIAIYDFNMYKNTNKAHHELCVAWHMAGTHI